MSTAMVNSRDKTMGSTGGRRANASMTEKPARQLTETAVEVVGRVVWQSMGIAGASGSDVDGFDFERTATTEEESRTRWPAWQRGPRDDGWGIAGSTRSYHRRGSTRKGEGVETKFTAVC